VNGEFDILGSAAAGMDAQRAVLDLAARNVAASEADGDSFARLVPRFAFASAPGDADAAGERYEPPDDPESGAGSWDESDADAPPIRLVGYARETGVAPDAVSEMVAVLDAQRAYDADASVFDIGKRLAERTIDAGRLQ
jgi:flagellar basal body rod protein FlgC